MLLEVGVSRRTRWGGGRLEQDREIGRWRELGFQTLLCHPVNAKGVTRAGAWQQWHSCPQSGCVIWSGGTPVCFGGLYQSISCTPWERDPLFSTSLCPLSVRCPLVFLAFPDNSGNVVMLQVFPTRCIWMSASCLTGDPCEEVRVAFASSSPCLVLIILDAV